MDTLIRIHVEILGNNDEPGEVCCLQATANVPPAGIEFCLDGPHRDLTGKHREPKAFYAIAQKENYIYYLSDDRVEIFLQDDECLRNKRKKPKTVVKDYIKHGWKSE